LAVDQIFRSTEKRQKIRSTDYENFDQLIKHNFDQLIFGQVIIPHVLPIRTQTNTGPVYQMPINRNYKKMPMNQTDQIYHQA